jgi:SagB-type dehydrogenase family enzyme
MLDAADTRSLALLYHLNSGLRLDPSQEEHVVDYKEMQESGESVSLPHPAAVSALTGLIRRRRSCRLYAPSPLALADFAEILAGTYGLSEPLDLAGSPEPKRRAAPSAGGLYPLELYAAAQRVDGLEDGLYHYNVLDHALEPLQAGIDWAALGEALVAAPYLANANALVFMAAIFDRTLDKYAARGYRFVLLEAGHAAQNLCLLATERGLASLCVGGFMDAPLNRFLGLDPRTEAAVYCVSVGHSG